MVGDRGSRSGLPLQRTVNVTFAVAVAVLVLTGAVSLWSAGLSRRAALGRRGSFMRQLEVGRLHSSIQDAETGQRGYLLTGDPEFLVPYRVATDSLPVRLGRLRALAGDLSSGEALVGRLEALIRDEMADLDETIALRQQNRLEQAFRVVRAGRGKALMDDIDDAFDAMSEQERIVFEGQEGRMRAADRLSIVTNAGAGLLGILFVTVATRAINRGIADRLRRAAQDLHGSEERFRILVEGVKDYAIIFLEPDGRVASWNPGAERIEGYTSGEIIGRGFANFYLPEEVAAGVPQQNLEQATAHGEYRGEGWRLRKDGSRFWAEIVINTLRDDTGRLGGFAKLTRDISERKRIEDDLLRSNEDLERFAYVASHDLQEPLRMVGSYVQLLGKRYKGKLDADADEFIAYALDGALRMQQLIEDLLKYSRITTQGAAMIATDANAVMARVIANLKVAIEETAAAVTFDRLPTVPADSGQLEHVFQYLVSNAIKFHGPEPVRVHVSAAPDQGGWRFCVRDNGIGIDPQYFERIFVIFQRLHARSEYAGTGIGLAIAKKIVERHAGRMWVESTLGQGAAFFFTLPGSNGD